MKSLLIFTAIGDLFAKLFCNLGLKVVLWLPYMLTLLYFGTGMAVLKLRYDIPTSEHWYVIIGVLLYGAFMDISQHIRKKYWGLTRCKDL